MILFVHVYGQEVHLDKPELTMTNPPLLEQALSDSSGIYDALHYNLELTFPMESSAFSGVMDMECRANQNIPSEITLHMAGLTPDSVFVDDVPAHHSQQGEKLFIKLPAPLSQSQTFTVTVAYHGSPENEGFYFYPLCAFTFAEPTDARRWFPCHDVPWDKATASLQITVPKGVEVASIGLLEDRVISPDELWETFHWRTDLPVSTYLFCVTMSHHYARWSDWYVTSEGDSIEMPYYVFTWDSAEAVQDFVNMVPAMEFFSEVFGPYPFEKYGMAEIEPSPFGGMEHQTMTTISSNWVRGDQSQESGLVHELAHMWWGDAVTLNDWPAIWLNEGFAVYGEALWHEHLYGPPGLQGYMEYCQRTYLERTRSDNFPIYDPNPLFHYGITYKKGGFVLHMLRSVVGDEDFFSIIQNYYETYKYGNASISDFQSVSESISGIDLEWFFQQWIYDEGHPKIEYYWTSQRSSGGRYKTLLLLKQVQTNGPVFRMPLDIRLEGQTRSEDKRIELGGRSGHHTLTTNFEPATITLDPDHWLLHESEEGSIEGLRSDEIPSRIALYPNAPNPFNGFTMLNYDLPGIQDSWQIKVDIYNLLGQRVRTLVDGQQQAGSYQVLWDGRDDHGLDLPSGVYFTTMETEGFSQKWKMLLVR